MKTYSKESTAKTQATKMSAKTGDTFYIEQIGDEFAVMTGAEFLLLKMEQEAAKKVVAAAKDKEKTQDDVAQAKCDPTVVFQFIRETPACLVVIAWGKERWIDKSRTRGYVVMGEAPAQDVKVTLCSEYAKVRKDLFAKAA